MHGWMRYGDVPHPGGLQGAAGRREPENMTGTPQAIAPGSILASVSGQSDWRYQPCEPGRKRQGEDSAPEGVTLPPRSSHLVKGGRSECGKP